MKTPKSVQDLLNKSMDRKEFLRYVGVGSLLLMGGGMILNSLGGVNKLVNKGSAAKPRVAAEYGYGASVYGGGRTLG